MPEVRWNYEQWNDAHTWDEDGDEWSGMAAHCGQPYVEWKSSLSDEFLKPYLGESKDVLEVAPGHGRWTQQIVGRCRSLTLVDLSDTCLAVCKDKFAGVPGTSFVLTDGASLPGVKDSSIDFIWSFDSFVHMELDVIDSYLAEFKRVLRPGGTAVIHHAGMRDWSMRWAPLARSLGRPGRVTHRLISQGRLRDSGNRSNVSRVAFADAVVGHGLALVSQRRSWGPDGQYDVAKYSDWITTARAGS